MAGLFANAQVANGGSISLFGTVRMQEVADGVLTKVTFEVYADWFSSQYRGKNVHVRLENEQMVAADRSGKVLAALCSEMFVLVGRHSLCLVQENGNLRKLIGLNNGLSVPFERGGWMLSAYDNTRYLKVDSGLSGKVIRLMTLCENDEEGYRAFDESYNQVSVTVWAPVSSKCFVK